MNVRILNPEIKILQDLSRFIYEANKKDADEIDYRLNHSVNVQQYALAINKRLGFPVSQRKLSYIAFAHDILKECALNPSDEDLVWQDHRIPQNINRYVRTNLDVLEKYKMDDYFNTDAGLHGLAAAIFLYVEFGIRDPEILYPIMFHSCPIMSIYETLTPRLKNMIDIIILADKLASNISKINRMNKKAPCDLDLLVFGKDGHEFNYGLGLYIAMLMKAGNNGGNHSEEAVNYYHKRLINNNPFMGNIKLGGNVEWPKRKSGVLKTPY